MTYDELVDYLQAVRGLDRDEAETAATAAVIREAQPVPVYVCPDPEGAYEQMVRDTFGEAA